MFEIIGMVAVGLLAVTGLIVIISAVIDKLVG